MTAYSPFSNRQRPQSSANTGQPASADALAQRYNQHPDIPLHLGWKSDERGNLWLDQVRPTEFERWKQHCKSLRATRADIYAVPEQWRRIAYEQDILRRLPDGSYDLRRTPLTPIDRSQAA